MMSTVALRIFKDTFSSPWLWPWPCGLCPWPWPCPDRSTKFSVTHIDKSTDTTARKVLLIRVKTVILMSLVQ